MRRLVRGAFQPLLNSAGATVSRPRLRVEERLRRNWETDPTAEPDQGVDRPFDPESDRSNLPVTRTLARKPACLLVARLGPDKTLVFRSAAPTRRAAKPQEAPEDRRPAPPEAELLMAPPRC